MTSNEPTPEFRREPEKAFAQHVREFVDTYAVVPPMTAESSTYGTYRIIDDDEALGLDNDVRLWVAKHPGADETAIRAEIALQKPNKDIIILLIVDYNDDVHVNGTRFNLREHGKFGVFLGWLNAGRLEADDETSRWRDAADDLFETFTYPLRDLPGSDQTP